MTGKWLFYLSSDTGYNAKNNSLQRVRTDGKRNRLVESNINFITSVNKLIFYSKNGGGLYKINANNSKKKIKLCDDRIGDIYIKRSWIYYNNLNDNDNAYKIRMNGKRRQIVE